MEEVICLNLGKSRSKLFKEITHIFETISGVIKIEIMYMGPIVVQKLNLNILIEAVLVPGLIYAYEWVFALGKLNRKAMNKYKDWDEIAIWTTLDQNA